MTQETLLMDADLRRHEILSDPGIQEDLVTTVAVLGDPKGRRAALTIAESLADPTTRQRAEEHIWLVSSGVVQQRVAPVQEARDLVAAYTAKQIELAAARAINPAMQQRVQERLRADDISWDRAAGHIMGPAR